MPYGAPFLLSDLDADFVFALGADDNAVFLPIDDFAF